MDVSVVKIFLIDETSILTHGIRQVYLNLKMRTIKVQLTTQKQLDITLDSREQCQALYDQLLHIKTRPNDTTNFPKHQPKTGIVKPDPTSAYLTANDTPSDLMLNPFYVGTSITHTPSKRRSIVQRPTAVPEQTHKKTRTQHTDCASDLHQLSKDAYDQIMSSPSVTLTDNSDRLRQVRPPAHREEMIMTPKKPTLDLQANKTSGSPSITTLSPFSSMKPQFHSAIPSPRVLRTVSERTRRYGREVGVRKSRRLSLHERLGGTRCVTAVLQALFWLDPVARELREPYRPRFNESQPALFKSLVDSFSPFSKHRRAEVKEETVSENVIKSIKGKLGDDDDARGFFNDTINQVRREFRERNVDGACPLPMSTGGLFSQFFDAHQISFECEACQSESAMVHRSISKLPDILVVYLKRFTLRPTHGCNKDRSRVTIDGTLEFSQFCSPAALSLKSSETTRSIYPDEDQPHIPSDSPSSSGSLWLSSISPTEEVFSSSTSSPTRYDYIDVDLYEPTERGTASNPFLLNSDEGESYDVSVPPSEDEQYQWAMEESLRASQTLSQESVQDGSCNEDKRRGDSTAAGPNKMDTPNNSKNLAEIDHVKDDSTNESNTRRKDGLVSSIGGTSVTIVDEDKNCSSKYDNDEDGDEEIKAALLASLIPEDYSVLGDKELHDRENRELEEAIRRSLLDSEENKENISPEKRVGKKGHKGKRPSVLTRSCSQSQLTSLEWNESAPPRLLRANTVDVIAKSQSIMENPFLSQQQSQEDSAPVTPETNDKSNDDFLFSSSASIAESSTASEKRKGKDRAYKKVQTETQDRSVGLFQLQAMVSHTGLVSSTSEGHYVCDGLGADGIWRCYDGGSRTKIGTISDLSQHRGRSGYLFFYVHCYTEDS
ncbi:Ubiquitin carboxyl-terminal hydrolase 29 [Entomortierella chlamydospora]|uniref:Ubiquitin carboxyl-terminal hydrolase 29 n=1 Tax=Entomortierella chlamydospora TaxID=101097 RepID=A0A9P6MU55_9FUNG|nr:Ubiquitin carboxyl-terminal hydrolase 29 [Entomortierella chlamydospora]